MNASVALPSDFSPAVDAMIERRAAVNLFDPEHRLSDAEIERLADLATRAPSAFNLQNWRLIAVRTQAMKVLLRAAAWDQAKVEEAAVTFVVVGETADAQYVGERLAPMTEAGLMSQEVAALWIGMANDTYANPQAARDEAIRSATLLASTLMFAAEGRGLATGPISGFDREKVSRLLGLEPNMIPVLLVAIGRARFGNWAQKPRRPLSQLLRLI